MLLQSGRNKMIIDMKSGTKIGSLRSCDLKINEQSGKIEAILMPKNRLSGLFSAESDYIEIPWESIVRIGTDTIIVNLE